MLPRAARTDRRVPAHILTGFLGSGKTTFLRDLLADPGLSNTAVVINEFGEIGLDHLLVRQVSEDVVLLASGCLCCSVRDDLVSALAELMELAQTGSMSAFDQAVIETSGLADPAPILQAIMSERRLSENYRPGRVVTTFDSVNGDRTLEHHPEAVQQVALADQIVLTKTDLVEAWRPDALADVLFRINPAVTPLYSRRGRTPSADIVLLDSNTVREGGSVENLRITEIDHPVHSQGIATFTVELARAVNWSDFVDWLELLLSSRGESILRVKGLLSVTHDPRPVVIQGVQHVLYPPENLDKWPDTVKRTRLVFIARGLTASAIERSLMELQMSAT